MSQTPDSAARISDSGGGMVRNYQYRSLPVTIEAVQWDSDNLNEVLAFVVTHSPAWAGKGFRDATGIREAALWVEKSSAWCSVPVGDWIVAERDGTGVYPCADTEFQTRYEPQLSGRKPEEDTCG